MMLHFLETNCHIWYLYIYRMCLKTQSVTSNNNNKKQYKQLPYSLLLQYFNKHLCSEIFVKLCWCIGLLGVVVCLTSYIYLVPIPTYVSVLHSRQWIFKKRKWKARKWMSHTIGVGSSSLGSSLTSFTMAPQSKVKNLNLKYRMEAYAYLHASSHMALLAFIKVFQSLLSKMLFNGLATLPSVKPLCVGIVRGTKPLDTMYIFCRTRSYSLVHSVTFFPFNF